MVLNAKMSGSDLKQARFSARTCLMNYQMECKTVADLGSTLGAGVLVVALQHVLHTDLLQALVQTPHLSNLA